MTEIHLPIFDFNYPTTASSLAYSYDSTAMPRSNERTTFACPDGDVDSFVRQPSVNHKRQPHDDGILRNNDNRVSRYYILSSLFHAPVA